MKSPILQKENKYLTSTKAPLIKIVKNKYIYYMFMFLDFKDKTFLFLKSQEISTFSLFSDWLIDHSSKMCCIMGNVGFWSISLTHKTETLVTPPDTC